MFPIEHLNKDSLLFVEGRTAKRLCGQEWIYGVDKKIRLEDR